jgi:hypothetical protein
MRRFTATVDRQAAALHYSQCKSGRSDDNVGRLADIIRMEDTESNRSAHCVGNT